MKKREIIISYILITAAFLLCGITSVNAEGCDNYNIYINNCKLDNKITVQDFDNIDYIPIKQLQSILKLTVKEDSAAKSLVFTLQGKTIEIADGTDVKINDSQSIKLDAPFVIKDNEIYIPIIAVIDIFDWQVEVMDEVKCIRIKTHNDAMPVGKLLDAELNLQAGKVNAPSTSYPRVAYLTFDDGLDSKITPLILDILKENDIRATFFILGKNVEKNKVILKRMLDERHSIGNHTYTHQKENIYSSASGLQKEVEKANTAIFNTVGITTKLFRPPYGGTYIRKAMFKAVLNPYRTILWNVDSMDSKSLTIKSDEIARNVINQVKNKRSAVIIMHDSSTHIETVKALPAIIKYLKDNGFAILPIEEDTEIYYQY